jgi:hypothetical protein
MRWRHLPLFAFVLLLPACSNVCKPLSACGTFTFTGTKVDTPETNGLDMSLSFAFTPSACGSSCTCNTVCYVQMVRTVDMETMEYIYPSDEKKNRATGNGWYVDRLEGKIWGYYGRNDDGSFAGTLTPGSDTTPAILVDSPSRPEVEPWIHIWWQAVSVPVCIQPGSGCVNKLLGYYFWSWLVDASGKVSDPIHARAWEPLQTEFDSAVSAWNTQAPTLGKNTFPAFTRLGP